MKREDHPLRKLERERENERERERGGKSERKGLNIKCKTEIKKGNKKRNNPTNQKNRVTGNNLKLKKKNATNSTFCYVTRRLIQQHYNWRLFYRHTGSMEGLHFGPGKLRIATSK